MQFRILLLSVLIFFSEFLIAGEEHIHLIPNKGQWNAPFKYKAVVPGGVAFFQNQSIRYHFYNSNEYKHHSFQKNKTPLKTHAFEVTLLNSNPNASIKNDEPTSHYYNFLLKNNPNNWKSKVHGYERITYGNIYSNIDFTVYSYENTLKYDFIVSPGGNPDFIQLRYNAVEKLKINKDGHLIITTSVNKIIEQSPIAYQIVNNEKQWVDCRFELIDNTLSFVFPNSYDNTLPLIIDPVLIFASYSGSTSDNFGMTATYGYDGSLFAGGTAFSIGYPTTLGAFDETFNGTPAQGITDVVISRYDASGTNLIYSTYLGGAEAETVHSLIADTGNQLIMYGATSSLDFPTSTNAYQNTFSGGTPIFFVNNGTNFRIGTDIYVTRLSADGTTLIGSTFIGGSANDGINYNPSLVYTELMNNYGDQYRGEVMIDDSNNIYVTSSTRSTDFPSLNGFDGTLDGEQDAVVFKFDSALTTLKWSTYLGGTEKDAGYSIKVSSIGDVYVCGGTTSSDFPTTMGTLLPTFQGGITDGFITKIQKNGSSILASTYDGTNNYDQNYFLELDRFDDIYTVGQTQGTYPITAGTYNNPNSTMFISKYNGDLNNKFFSTIVGNGQINSSFSPSAFLVDACQNIYLSGWGGNILTQNPLSNMPVTTGALQVGSGDGFNFHLMVLSRDANALLYGTYFGGNSSQEHVDGGTSRFDKQGVVYQSVCAGCWNNNDFPTTPGAWSNTNNSIGCNNGVFKLDFEVIPHAKFTTSQEEGCAALTVQFQNTSQSISGYLWDFGNNDTTSTVNNPIRTYPNPGTYNVTLYVTDSICNIQDTAVRTIIVHEQPSITPTPPITTCKTDTTICITTTGSNLTHHWSSNNNFTDTIGNIDDLCVPLSFTDSTLFYVKTSNGMCHDTVPIVINYVGFTILTNDTSICRNENVTIAVSEDPSHYNYSYSWTPPASIISGANTATPTVSPQTNTTYTSSVTNQFGCQNIDSVIVQVVPEINLNGMNNFTTCTRDTLIYATTSTSGNNFYWSTNNQFSDTLNPSPYTDSTLSVNILTSATYFIMADNGICSEIDSITIDFRGIGLQTFNDTICEGLQTTLSAQDINATSATYQWSPTSSIVGPSNILTPTVAPQVTTTYSVDAQNIHGCSAQENVTITVLPPPTIQLPNNSITCIPDSVISPIISPAGSAVIWSSNNQFTDVLSTQVNFTPTVTSLDTTFYIQVNNGGCSAIDSMTISYRGIKLSTPDVTVCQGDTGYFVTSANQNNLTYNWAPNNTIIGATTQANMTAFDTQNNTYTIEVTNSYGCSANDTAELYVVGNAANFYTITATEDTLFNGETTNITVGNVTSETVLWTPAQDLSSSTAASVTASPTVTTEYTATISDQHGCTYQLRKTIYAFEVICEDPEIFIPNAFTPNNDGENDILLVNGKWINEMHLAIYDRWGEKVFETFDPSNGWDGSYKGKLVSPAVFVYYLTVRCIDGQDYFKKGNITLVR